MFYIEPLCSHVLYVFSVLHHDSCNKPASPSRSSGAGKAHTDDLPGFPEPLRSLWVSVSHTCSQSPASSFWVGSWPAVFSSVSWEEDREQSHTAVTESGGAKPGKFDSFRLYDCAGNSQSDSHPCATRATRLDVCVLGKWCTDIWTFVLADLNTVIVGPQCVPRRIYSITTGGGRSQIFVAVEGIHPCSCQHFWTALIIFLSKTIWQRLFTHRLHLLLSCQRVHVCVFSVVVQLVPAHWKALTVRAARSFILKGPSDQTPAALAAAWWRWGSTPLRNIL